MSLISGRFHWLASNRPTLPRPQFSMSQTWLAVYPLWTRNWRRRLDSRRLATVAPYASSVILDRLLDRMASTVYRYLSCESQIFLPSSPSPAWLQRHARPSGHMVGPSPECAGTQRHTPWASPARRRTPPS